MKKVFSYITSFILIASASILVLYGIFSGFKILPIIFGFVLAFLGLAIPAAHKNQMAMQEFKESLVTLDTYVAGVTFQQDNVQSAYEQFLKDEELKVNLIPDPDNEYNKDAVKVLINDIDVGFIPDVDLKKYQSYLNAYEYIKSDVDFHVEEEIYIDLTMYFKKK